MKNRKARITQSAHLYLTPSYLIHFAHTTFHHNHHHLTFYTIHTSSHRPFSLNICTVNLETQSIHDLHCLCMTHGNLAAVIMRV